MNCKECIYCFMDKHPVWSLIFMALPMLVLFLLHNTQAVWITVYVAGGVFYLFLTLIFAAYTADTSMTLKMALKMALKLKWNELSEHRDVSTHVAVATAMSLYAMIMIGLAPDGSIFTIKEIGFIVMALAVAYIYLTEQSRIYLGRHTPEQTDRGMGLGIALTLPLVILFIIVKTLELGVIL